MTNLYQMVCAEVFTLLAKDAGIQDNPFASIRRAKPDAETREAFTTEVLKLIYDNLDGFTRPLFMMAVWTGLREGDICTLKWSEVDLIHRLITRKTRKTGTTVQIPIADQLYTMLTATARTESEYVFPKHAEMYLANSDGVSYRVKKFLEGLGIQTTRVPEGRTRVVIYGLQKNGTLKALKTVKSKNNVAELNDFELKAKSAPGGQFFLGVTSTNAKKGSAAYYNVDVVNVSGQNPAPPSTSDGASLSMPETDNLGISDALSFGQYDADALAGASASALADLDDKSAWLNIASLA